MTADDLREYLGAYGVTQRGLARHLDLNERTVRYFCAGRRPIPRTVEFAVKWLFSDWPSNVPIEQSGGSPDGQGEKASQP